LKAKDYEFFGISAATHEGLEPFLAALRQRVAELPPPVIYKPEARPVVEDTRHELSIAKEDGTWQVRHAGLLKAVERLNLESADAVVRLHKLLDEIGVIERLREMGVEDGDTVAIGDFEFDFVD
jgi:GTP-binding protein